MGFFSGYRQARVDGLLAGLGNLTAPGNTAASKEAKRVVSAFIKGAPAHGSCSGSGEERHCGIVSTGSTLRTETMVFASRPQGDQTRVTVCIPNRAAFDATGKETQESKDIRAVSAALLTKLQTGLGVRTDKAGDRRFIGRKGRSRVVLPGQCLTVRIPEKEALDAEIGITAAEELRAELKGKAPTKAQWEKRKKLVAARRAELKAAIASRKRENRAMVAKFEKELKAQSKPNAADVAKLMKQIRAAGKPAASAQSPASTKPAARPSISSSGGPISPRMKAALVSRAKAGQAAAMKKRFGAR